MLSALHAYLCAVAVFVALNVVAGQLANVAAQSVRASVPKYEFRGTWIATVLRLDWPRSTSSEEQERELIYMLDRLEDAGINAAFFQVRPESDAMYASEIEPWSYWLTGQQGEAPEPFYDPLAFAIAEAHKRGIELHAWINPYRADRGSTYPQSAQHITVAQPEWILSFNGRKILDPGLPAVRDHVASVVADIVRHYDVDGVVFDDYFYPYPPNQISEEDFDTFEMYGGNFADVGAWRRSNVDLLIEQVSDTVRMVAPEATFGIAPFGIWKNGIPDGIAGLDAYNVIYADAVNWLDQQWVDYLVPLLSWGFGGRQDYGVLAPWWAEHAARNNRHVYTGHGLYRADPNTFDGTLHGPGEIPRQVRFNRDHPDIQGGVYFRASNITQLHSQGIADTLTSDLYRYPALPPIMDWRSLEQPSAVEHLTFEWTGGDEITLRWMSPTSHGIAGAKLFAVYRVRSEHNPDPSDAMDDPRHLLAITSEPETTDSPDLADVPYHYFVTAVSANSIESEASEVVSLEGRATTIERPVPRESHATLQQNYPNPFRERTVIRFALSNPSDVSLRVYNLLGQLVAVLLEEDAVVGARAAKWDGKNETGQPVAAGTYIYVLETDVVRSARMMAHVR